MQPLSTTNIQSVFLDQIRQVLPKNLSFPDELAEVLNVSRDSVYRRIRGETVLSLEEVKKLCVHYKISLDALLSPSSEIISFRKRRIDPENFTLEKWLLILTERPCEHGGIRGKGGNIFSERYSATLLF